LESRLRADLQAEVKVSYSACSKEFMKTKTRIKAGGLIRGGG
jgi:hypothetical protein